MDTHLFEKWPTIVQNTVNYKLSRITSAHWRRIKFFHTLLIIGWWFFKNNFHKTARIREEDIRWLVSAVHLKNEKYSNSFLQWPWNTWFDFVDSQRSFRFFSLVSISLISKSCCIGQWEFSIVLMAIDTCFDIQTIQVISPVASKWEWGGRS